MNENKPDRLAAARKAREIPEGYQSAQHGVVLPADLMEKFAALNRKERGAIVEAGFRDRSFPWEHYSLLCSMMGHREEA